MEDAFAASMLDGANLAWTAPVVSEPARRRDGDATVAGGTAALDDAALVAACLAGNPDAFGVIVERHRRSIYQLCYRFVGSHEDASDLCQDVFLRAYRGLRRFRGESSLTTWLYRIGVNVCLNKVSARTPPFAVLDDHTGLASPGPDVAGNLLRQERARRVRAALARLPRKQRVTLILRVYQELSHKEIADVLKTTVGAVKANCFHALGNLKRILSAESPDWIV